MTSCIESRTLCPLTLYFFLRKIEFDFLRLVIILQQSRKRLLCCRIWPFYTKNLSEMRGFFLFDEYHLKDHFDTFSRLILKNICFLFSILKQDFNCFSAISIVSAFLTSEFISVSWIDMSETMRTSSVVVVIVIHSLQDVSDSERRMFVEFFIYFENHSISIIFVCVCSFHLFIESQLKQSQQQWFKIESWRIWGSNFPQKFWLYRAKFFDSNRAKVRAKAEWWWISFWLFRR